MKLRFFTLFFAVILLMGCAQNTSDENMKATGDTVSVENTDTASEDSISSSEDPANASETQVASEEEPYILTFEASAIDGEAYTSECFEDSKLTMINIWGTYCNPCLNEMPDLGEIATEYDASEFQLLGIICDVTEDAESADIEEALALIADTGAHYPHLLLNESLYMNLVGAVDAVPTTFFFNQSGELLGYVKGAKSKETWEDIIDGLLAEME